MRYRCLDVRIWGDEKFNMLTKLQPSGQALFLYLLTNSHTTAIPGLYRAGPAAMAEELKWDFLAFMEAIKEVIQLGLVRADFEARVIFIPNAIKYNKIQSINVVKSWKHVWDEIPECQLKLDVYYILRDFMKGMSHGFLKSYDKACLMPKVMPKAIQEQEQEQEQEQDIQVS